MSMLYKKPVRELMRDMVLDKAIKPGEVITRESVVSWFNAKYPKVKVATIHAHLIRMSTNVATRLHYSANSTGNDNLFFRLDPSHFRLYDAASDPTPISKENSPESFLQADEEPTKAEASEFAYEKDLQSFLSKNLELIENGLKLYEDDGINGIEFPAGGRFIDILAVDIQGRLVVVELKVSKGYDRVVGQLLRYMGWIEQNLAETGQEVRGIIIAKEITEDLRLATSRINGVSLFEYELSVSLRRVS